MSLKKRIKKVIKSKFLPFQIGGMWFFKKTKGRGILGDDMGVGKTIQFLGWAAVNPSKRPIIVVVPASAKYNWEDQIQEHTYMKCQVLSGRTPYPITENLIIINYDIITYWIKELLKIKPHVIVFDESHYLKTRTALRTKACREIARKVKCIIPMSGTPIINRPIEFFPVLNMVAPKEFSSFWKYAFRYCNPKKGWQGKGWDFTGASHLDELRERIKPYFLRRTKKEVLPQLPKKRRTILPIDISNSKEYEKATLHFLQWYRKKAGTKKARRAKKAQALVKIGQLKQLVAEGKIKKACEWIDNFLYNTNEKLVVFVYHRNIFNTLIKKYKKIAAVGGKAGKERQNQVRLFQEEEWCRLFIASLKGDKEAITLTASSTVLFLELGWTPSEHDQAEDRVNRIGQKDNKIGIYYILGRNTIDQYVWNIIEKKRKVIDEIMNGKSQRHINTNVLEIVQLLKGKKSGRKE
ncbi:MAG: DEAD/DEAH box helicase [Candidatus Heimdallarchaeaceae archaeon]